MLNAVPLTACKTILVVWQIVTQVKAGRTAGIRLNPYSLKLFRLSLLCGWVV